MKIDMNTNYKDLDGKGFNVSHNRSEESVQIFIKGGSSLVLDLHALKDLSRDLAHIVELMERWEA